MSEEKSAYAELLGELETMSKAMPGGKEDDAKIQAAAGEAGEVGSEAGADEPDGDEDGEGEPDGDGDEPMGKSFTAVIDGQEVEAIDGTALVKSLMEKVESSESDMVKAMTVAVDMLKSVTASTQAQAEEIALLKAEVARIGGTGVGRKSALSINEKTVAGVTDQAPALTPEIIMTKAHAAATEGRITWKEAALVDGALRAQQVPDSGLLSKIVQ